MYRNKLEKACFLEPNETADKLSKESLSLQEGTLITAETDKTASF